MSKILDIDDARELRERLRLEGKRVVVTNGCFDLLHVGHVRFLQEARSLGDALLVALNGDASVRALKGRDRPLVPAAERAEVVAALACVDAVVVFEEPTPDNLLRLLRPDVHCKGGNYALEEIPEAAHAGTLLLGHTRGRSTSGLVAEIVRRHAEALG